MSKNIAFLRFIYRGKVPPQSVAVSYSAASQMRPVPDDQRAEVSVEHDVIDRFFSPERLSKHNVMTSATSYTPFDTKASVSGRIEAQRLFVAKPLVNRDQCVH